MVFIMIPFFLLPNAQRNSHINHNNNTTRNFTTNATWQIFLAALLPFILTVLTLGDLEDFLEFLPLVFLSILTTRNQITDFLTRMHPSLAVILAFAVPTLYQAVYKLILPTSAVATKNERRFLQKKELDAVEPDMLHTVGGELAWVFFGIFTVFVIAAVLLSNSLALLEALPNRVSSFLIGFCEVLGLPVLNVPKGAYPASKNAINAVENSAYRVTEKDLLVEKQPYVTCAVCLSNLRLGDRSVKLGCFHIFCSECLAQWLRKSCTCPTCRYELETDNFLYEMQRKRRNKITKQPYYVTPDTLNKEELYSKSVSELKTLAKDLNINIGNVLEKTELITLIEHKFM